jgi:hypothetical protein
LPLEIGRSVQLAIAFQHAGAHIESLSVRSCGFMTLRGAFAPPPENRVQVGPEPGLLIDADANYLLNETT